jgi:hypothetical protein
MAGDYNFNAFNNVHGVNAGVLFPSKVTNDFDRAIKLIKEYFGFFKDFTAGRVDNYPRCIENYPIIHVITSPSVSFA